VPLKLTLLKIFVRLVYMVKEEKALLALGLGEKEAHIYLALLHSGSLSLSDVAKKAGVRRTTVYQHIDELLRRGLVSKTIKGKRILYTPENPNKILKEVEKGRQLFLESVPDLEALYENARHRPNTRLYEGVEGIKAVLTEVGSSFAPIDAFFSPEKFFKVVPNSDTNNFLQLIKDKQNVLRDLVEYDSVAEQFVKRVKKEQNSFHKVKLLPKGFSVSVDVLITGNKVAIISFDHLTAFVVENPEIALFHRSTHQFFWNSLV
jgi:HTH-type transcriptional regulator, sugar sensing transcriptional regulator